jgi:hypothetical protein
MIGDTYDEVNRNYDHRWNTEMTLGGVSQLCDKITLQNMADKLAESLKADANKQTFSESLAESFKAPQPTINIMLTTPVDEKQSTPTAHPLQAVFDAVIEQVTKGKGKERHGNGKEFMSQPWVELCDTYGTGFAFGQSQKKMSESQGMSGEARKRELLGASAYLAMAILHEFYIDKQK